MSKPVIFLSAGEPSGDFLGSRLMISLKNQLKGNVTFMGVGGSLMEAEGLPSLFPMKELSIMGLAEILPHILRIRRRIRETVTYVEQKKPHVVVTIDAPGFNFRVGKALKKRLPSIPLIHYGAPSVWAWRSGRAGKIAQFLDHLLALFPFEPPYFLKENLPTTFVGHPVTEISPALDSSFRARHNIAPSVPLLTLLPGSRQGEISRLMPVFQETIKNLQKKIPDLHVVIPTLPHLQKEIENRLIVPATIIVGQAEKFAAYNASQVALAASGTVSLELAVAKLPMVIGYKVNILTYLLLKLLVKVKYVCLVNILLNKPVVPEYVQKECCVKNLSEALGKFLGKEGITECEKTRQLLQNAVTLLTPPAQCHQNSLSPSDCAAREVCKFIRYS
jgi:lipid-A-disaccharide synthase